MVDDLQDFKGHSIIMLFIQPICNMLYAMSIGYPILSALECIITINKKIKTIKFIGIFFGFKFRAI